MPCADCGDVIKKKNKRRRMDGSRSRGEGRSHKRRKLLRPKFGAVSGLGPGISGGVLPARVVGLGCEWCKVIVEAHRSEGRISDGFRSVRTDRLLTFSSLCLDLLLVVLSFCEKNRELLDGVAMTCSAVRCACLMSWDKIFVDLDGRSAVPLVVLRNCPRVRLRLSGRSCRREILYVVRNMRNVRDLEVVRVPPRELSGVSLFVSELGLTESCRSLDISGFRSSHTRGMIAKFPNLERLRVSLPEVRVLTVREWSVPGAMEICQGGGGGELQLPGYFLQLRNLEEMELCSHTFFGGFEQKGQLVP